MQNAMNFRQTSVCQCQWELWAGVAREIHLLLFAMSGQGGEHLLAPAQLEGLINDTHHHT